MSYVALPEPRPIVIDGLLIIQEITVPSEGTIGVNFH